MFPSLQLRHSDVTVTTPIPKCKTFEVGEQVLVYDKLKKTSTVGKVLKKVSNSSYSVDIEGTDKHISIDNMSKTLIKDSNSDDNISVHSDTDNDSFSDNESIVSDFSDIQSIGGLQPQQQIGVIPILQPAVPGSVGRPGRPPNSSRRGGTSPKKTRTGRKY